MPCTIRNLGNESVSWIRARDSHILTVDTETFVSNPRISTIHRDKIDDDTWTLQIKNVAPEDDGMYECQISTEPKLSHFVHLIVRVPKVRIFGDRELFVTSSTSVQLKCVISQSPQPPNYIEWSHDGRIIDARLAANTDGGSSGNGVRHGRHHKALAVVVNGGWRGNGGRVQVSPAEHIAEGTAMSTLTIWSSRKSDSGVYACRPAQMGEANVTLNVVDNNPAELQTSGSPSIIASLGRPLRAILTTLIILISLPFPLVANNR